MAQARQAIIERMFRPDADCEDAMALIWRLIEPHFDVLVERFLAHEAMVELSGGVAILPDERFRLRLHDHLRRVFVRRDPAVRFTDSPRIAVSHAAAGLPPSLYVASYYIFVTVVADELANGFRLPPDVLMRLRRALMRAAAEDVATTLAHAETPLDPGRGHLHAGTA